MTPAAQAEAQRFARTHGGAVLAADVGGTYARVGVVRYGAGVPAVSGYRKYRCADYPTLTAIFEDFLGGQDRTEVTRGAIACAGYVLDDGVINANLPWPVSLKQIRADLGLADLRVVNDFTAIAFATAHVTERDVTPVAVAAEPIAGPVLVVGPGTGLGAAVRIPGTRSSVILSTEAGQAALTASTALEIDVLSLLLAERAHVPTEQILSGPGLANLYAGLGRLRGIRTAERSPPEIADAALAGADSLARETLQTFCGWLGSVVGNLVMLYGAQGGVYLAGGILPQIREFLLRSDFVARFRDKGAMRPMLERVPVNLIEHGQLGVLGAAGWFLENQAPPG
ncbi:MAG: glucokinase [Xanthomonadaceae bacterium]|nr:glucokinase [Xanthomonadaceae bacterium]